MIRGILRVRLLLFGLVFSGLVAAVLSLVSLRSQIFEIGDGAAVGPVWFVAGIVRDLQEFQITLAGYEFGTADAETVNLRFDILWSRVSGAGVGEVAQKLAHYKVDPALLDRLMGLLQRYEQVVVDIDAVSSAEIQTLLADFGAYNGPVHEMSMAVLQATSHEAKGWRDALLTISSANALIRAMIIGAILILMMMLWVDSITAKRELSEKDKLLVAAEAANEAKSRFLAVINHELRTPLTSIKGAISLMSAGAFGAIPETFKKPINIAERNCAQLGALISDLLDVEKFSSSSVEYRFEKIALKTFIQEQVETNTPFADIYQVKLVVDPDMPDLIVDADSQRLGQVLANLLSNAAKFSNAGDRVVIGVEQADGRAVISVKDTGRGIPESARERIFDRFQQVDSSDVRERGGSGLGLNIVRSIIEAHGGKIGFDSVVGRGSTFRFDLSLAG